MAPRAHENRLVITQSVIRLNLSHAIVVRLHVYKTDVAILTWCLSSSIFRFAPQGANYNVDVIYFLPYLGIKKGAWGTPGKFYTKLPLLLRL